MSEQSGARLCLALPRRSFWRTACTSERTPMLACPDCVTARAVRASVFDETFWPKLGFVLAPFFFLALALVALAWLGAAVRRSNTGDLDP